MSFNTKSTLKCPVCNIDIAVENNEVNWCENCDWNVDPLANDRKENAFEKFLSSLGRKISEGIYTSVLENKRIEPRWTKEKVATISICLFVVALPAGLLLLNLLSYNFIPKLLFYTFLILTIGFFYVSYSKWLKKPENLVSRADYPLLYKLTDRICWEVGKYKISDIGILSDFNAFYTERGWGPFKKRYISLGLPLIEVLTDEELVALIAHEASHGANGDLMRSWLMHRTEYILAKSYFIFSPQHSHEGTNSRDASFLMVIVANYLFYGLAQAPLLCWKLMRKLYMRDSQEAEYYADLVATKACGKNAMINMLKKFQYFDEFDFAVGKLALEKEKYLFFDELKKLTQIEKSKRTLARLDRLEKMKGLGLDSTHPPTGYRISVIQEKGNELGTVKISNENSVQIRSEFSLARNQIVSELLDARLKVLFSG